MSLFRKKDTTWFTYEFYPFLEFIDLKPLVEKEKKEDQKYFARGKEFHEAIHINIKISDFKTEIQSNGKVIIKFKYNKIWWQGHSTPRFSEAGERVVEQELTFGQR